MKLIIPLASISPLVSPTASPRRGTSNKSAIMTDSLVIRNISAAKIQISGKSAKQLHKKKATRGKPEWL